jgi:hypothetical protein
VIALIAGHGIRSEPSQGFGQDQRSRALLDPVWNMFDVTPEGRGDFEPKFSYAST